MKYINHLRIARIAEYLSDGYKKKYDDSVKRKILAHLRSFPPCAFTSQPVIDAFTGEEVYEADNGYTDGSYTWYESQIYYFEKYDLALEEDFIAYVLERNP